MRPLLSSVALLVVGAALTSPASSSDKARACEPRDCHYCPVESKANPQPELSPFPDCACVHADGRLVIDAFHLENMALNRDGLGTIYVTGSGVAYATRGGKTAWAHPFDNGADDFVEGLARTVRDSKIGFMNKNLDVVIEPTWDFAFPFERGLEVVCEGCKIVPVCKDCDHSEVVDGKWGYIDSRGAVVIPVSHSRQDLPPRETVPSNSGQWPPHNLMNRTPSLAGRHQYESLGMNCSPNRASGRDRRRRQFARGR